MRKTLLFLGTSALIAAYFVGCGGDDGNGNVKPDAGTTRDAGTGPVDSGEPLDAGDETDAGEADAGTEDAGMEPDAGNDAGVDCLAGDYGDAGTLPMSVSTGPGAIYGYGTLEAGPPSDLLAIELKRRGPFTSGFTTGTFTLSGAESQYSTCATCVLIYGDVNPQGTPTQFFLAKAGTITLTSVEGRLTGTVSNVILDRVTIDAANGYVSTSTGDCEATITSAAFDGPFPVEDGGTADSGTPDSGTPDSGTPDSGMPGDGGLPEDAGIQVDAGLPELDAGFDPDAGMN